MPALSSSYKQISLAKWSLQLGYQNKVHILLQERQKCHIRNKKPEDRWNRKHCKECSWVLDGQSSKASPTGVLWDILQMWMGTSIEETARASQEYDTFQGEKTSTVEGSAKCQGTQNYPTARWVSTPKEPVLNAKKLSQEE